MRLVYGVSGEGSGHSSRAREVLRALVRAGHQVRVASYDRGLANLRDEFDVHPIEGLSITVHENRVAPLRTVLANLRRLPEGVRSWRGLQRTLFDEFQPQAVLCDFEPLTAHTARRRGLPLISIDNQHRLRWMDHPLPAELRGAARTARLVVRAMVPTPRVAYVTTFWFGRPSDPRARLFPPLLRAEVLELRPTRGEHVLVYFTKGFDAFLEVIRGSRDTRFLVYGAERSGVAGNVEYRPFSKSGFLEDLASARAVVATAGFTLLSECLHLRKPLFALPMRGQFEQELNAICLADLGLGMRAERADAGELSRFLADLGRFEAALARQERTCGNRELLADLAGTLDEIAGGG